MKRGEIWYARLPKEIKSRPVLILSRDSMSPRRAEISVAYLTTNIRKLLTEVRLTPADDGVDQVCVVNLDSINTIPKQALYRRVCALSAVKMEDVKDAILFAFDMR